MTDQTEKPKLGTRPPLGIKRTVETGKVKQSFSHGRSNTVVVEVKKRRILGKPGEPAPEVPKPAPAAEAPKPAAPARPAPTPAPRRAPVDDISSRRELQEKLLREAEEARMAQLEEARRRDDHASKSATEEERRRAEENRRAESEAAEAARLAAEAPPVEAAPEPGPVVEERAADRGDDEERGFRRPGG